MSVLIIFIQKAIVQGICILYGALGESMTEKSGNQVKQLISNQDRKHVPGMLSHGGKGKSGLHNTKGGAGESGSIGKENRQIQIK